MVDLTLIQGAESKGAVCLDGTLPGYHLHRGSGSGQNSWLIQLEGGGWCDTIRNCVYRKTTRRGSSKFMEKQIPFSGILSNKAEENPDFFNWNRVKLRYCDGASFSGDSKNEAAQLYFRGQRIWSAAMEKLMAEGMQNATQLQASIAPKSADPQGSWNECKQNNAECTSVQIQILQGFRNQMLEAINVFSMSTQNGLFINSCFAHCQSETQDTWFADDLPSSITRGLLNLLETGILIKLMLKLLTVHTPVTTLAII
ncbi:hypothetical protein GH714_004809 [Hevea brasiliensis]|uniref:Pectin acetylesterase n=1 Tax=Hevea brasiliensis TaxID=3981 RepID=A0A6A6MB55_HEVBR|nr:hypothetical protein GH714_004809 [Hevea brasiliensis]